MRQHFDGHGAIKGLRGLGSFFAITFDTAAAAQRFVKNCRTEGLIIGWTLHHAAIVRAAPPLCMNDEEVGTAIAMMLRAVKSV